MCFNLWLYYIKGECDCEEVLYVLLVQLTADQLGLSPQSHGDVYAYGYD